MLEAAQLRTGPYLPVVKLFTPDVNATWLLTELDPEDPDISFGLCDLGVGCPELGLGRHVLPGVGCGGGRELPAEIEAG